MGYIGIDIGGTAVKIGYVEIFGVLTHQQEASVNFDDYKTPIFETVKKELAMFLQSYKIDAYSLQGIGVSATGQIDTEKGVLIGTCGTLKNYSYVEFKRELMDIYHVPVKVMNDANCMVLAECKYGAGVGYKNVIGITIGTGIGGGLVTDGKMLLGERGLAAEIGHMITHHQGIPCSCGNEGCYERYASTNALIARCKEAGYKFDNARELFAYHINNECVGLVDCIFEWLQEVAAGCISLVHMFNPEIVLLGGGICEQEMYVIEPLRSIIFQHIMKNFACNLKIESANLGNQAGVLGAVAQFEEDSL